MTPLTFDPTPVCMLRDPALASNNVYMKRDDLLPFSFGGNKVRIAEAFLADMDARGATGLVMYGDRRSNLCRVLAMRCAQEGIPTVMVATDAEADAGDGARRHESFNAQMIDRFGIPVVIAAPNAIADAVDHACELLRERGCVPYYIYGSRLGTGNEGVAARAYAAAYGEICAWERKSGVSFDLIVTPYGTGSTQGGLVAGSLAQGDGRTIVGISVSSRTRERALAVLRETVRDYFVRQGLPVPGGLDGTLHLECSYNCGGYGLSSPEVEATIERVLRSDAIPLDPTYTGKAYAGMERYLAERQISGANVLFLHTGGTPLFFDHLARLQ